MKEFNSKVKNTITNVAQLVMEDTLQNMFPVIGTVSPIPVKFVYVESNNRRTTVAYTYDDPNKAIRVAKAECSKRDRFVKKIGREIASGRLLHHGGTVVSYDAIGGSSYKQVAEYIRNNVEHI